MWLVYSGIFVGTILTGLMTLGGVTEKKQSKASILINIILSFLKELQFCV